MIKSCWNLDSKKRPKASQIVEFLANNPRLISPCLDVPLASVQMENTGQLELHLPEKYRKCSLSISGTQEHCVPNGVVIDGGVVRQTSLPNPTDNGIAVSIQLDTNCVHEPLLGTRRTNSQLNLSKYVKMQHAPTDSGCNSDDYCNHELTKTHAVSML